MNIEEKIYVFLCALFSVLIITGNLVHQKFVFFTIPFFYSFELSVGAISYPFTFLITDLIVEFYGREKARFCVIITLVISGLIALLINLFISLEATSWSNINDEIFKKIFGFYGVGFFASLLANYIAQIIDIIIYWYLRSLTHTKYIWLRNIISTAVSLLIDTIIVNIFLVFFGAISFEKVKLLIINTYIFKLIFIICSIPFFYFAYYFIKFLKNNMLKERR